MSRRTIFWIVSVVILIHVGLFLYFGRMQALPKTKPLPKPNFGYREQVYIDHQTGEQVTYREISVSTKLADPSKLPPPPDYQKPATTPAAPAEAPPSASAPSAPEAAAPDALPPAPVPAISSPSAN